MSRLTQYPLSPGHIQILLHHYIMPVPYPTQESVFYQGAVRMLEADGMLEWNHNEHRWGATAKAAAWIRHLCAVPFPEQRWEVPHGA